MTEHSVNVFLSFPSFPGYHHTYDCEVYLNPGATSPTMHHSIDEGEGSIKSLSFPFDQKIKYVKYSEEESESDHASTNHSSASCYHSNDLMHCNYPGNDCNHVEEIYQGEISNMSSPFKPSDVEITVNQLDGDNSESDYEEKPKTKKRGASTKKKGGKKGQPKKQNKKKNIPGLIVQRVKTCLQDANNNFGKTFRKRINKSNTGRLKAFLEMYEKQWKTWNTIENYLLKDNEMGEIVLEAIVLFLNAENVHEYRDWVENGKMNAATKRIALEEKSFYVDKFEEMSKTIFKPDFVRKQVKSC